MAEHEFKVGDKVYSDVWQSGEVVKYEPETGYYLVDVGGMKVWSHKAALRKAVHQFQVGDQVAHTGCGNGTVIPGGMDIFGMYHVNVELENGGTTMCLPVNLRPRNFLSKIAEEQEIKGEVEMPLVSAPPMGPQWTTVDQQFNEVFKPERFQRNAYGQLVDTVTGLEADSDGLVQISSIRDSVRSIS